MSVPTSNTEYVNNQGSIILPSGAIVPYTGFNNYNSTTPTTSVPSGFLFCDGYWYNPSVYPNLFAVIGYNYGYVDVNNGYIPNTSNEITVKYFRVPNLMNVNQTYTFTNQYTGAVRNTFPNQNGGTWTGTGSLFTTIGGTSNAITTSSSVTLSVANLPPHNHGGVLNVSGVDAALYGSSLNIAVNPINNGATAFAGSGTAVSLPVPASFVMTYLIKL